MRRANSPPVAEQDLDRGGTGAARVRARQRLVEVPRHPLVGVGNEIGDVGRRVAPFRDEHAHEGGVAGGDAAVRVDGGDAEGRGLEQPVELCLPRAAGLLGLGFALVEHQHRHDPARPMPAADEVRREGAAILAQRDRD